MSILISYILLSRPTDTTEQQIGLSGNLDKHQLLIQDLSQLERQEQCVERILGSQTFQTPLRDQFSLKVPLDQRKESRKRKENRDRVVEVEEWCTLLRLCLGCLSVQKRLKNPHRPVVKVQVFQMPPYVRRDCKILLVKTSYQIVKLSSWCLPTGGRLQTLPIQAK